MDATGIQGASEIVAELSEYHPSHIILAGGTMGTVCGIVSSASASSKVIVVPAWKGCSVTYFAEILRKYNIQPTCEWEVWPDYSFGGFGNFDPQLIAFMQSFTATTSIPLDPVYTAKLMFAVTDKIKSGYFKSTDSIIAIHSGGLQGLEGFRYRFPDEWDNIQSSMTLG
jgi:1-aminocyclopropane-1-carboxylate deaminase